MRYTGTLGCLTALLLLGGCGSGGTADPAATTPLPGPVVSNPPLPDPPEEPTPEPGPPPVLTAAYANPDLALEPLADCQAVKDKAAASLLGQFLATEPDALSPRPLAPAQLPPIATDSGGFVYLQRDDLLIIADGTQSGTLVELSRLELAGRGTPEGLILDESRERLVALFGDVPNPATGFSPAGTYVVSIDVSDPTGPVEAGQLWLEGERIDIAVVQGGYRIVNRAVTDRGTRIWFQNPPLRAHVDDYRAAIANGDLATADSLAVEIEAIVIDAVGREAIETFLPFAFADGPVPQLPCTDVYAPEPDLRPGYAVVSTLDMNAGLTDRYAVQNNAGEAATTGGTLYIAQSTDGLATDDGGRWSAVYAIGTQDARPASDRYGAVSLPVSGIEFIALDGAIGILGQRFDDPIVQDFFRLDDNGSGELVLSGEIVAFAEGLRQVSTRLGDAIAVHVLNGLIPYWFAIDIDEAVALGPVNLNASLPALVTTDHSPAFGLLQSALGETDTLALLDVTQPQTPVLVETTRLALVSDAVSTTVDITRLTLFANDEVRYLLLPVRQSSDSETFVGYVVANGSAGLTTSALINHASFALDALCGSVPAPALPPGACDTNAFLDWVDTGVAAATGASDLEVVYAESSVGLTATIISGGGPPVTSELSLPYFQRP